MTVEIAKPNTPVVFIKIRGVEATVIDIREMIVEAVPRILGYGGKDSEDFMAWLKTDFEVFKAACPEPDKPDAYLLQDPHIHSIHRTIESSWDIHITHQGGWDYKGEMPVTDERATLFLVKGVFRFTGEG